MSIYLPDDLVTRVKEFDRTGNMSQLIQTALRHQVGALSAPSYLQRPTDAAELLRRAHEALVPAARAEYEGGYAAALRRIPDLLWRVLDDFAEHNFDLRRWLEGWRNGIIHTPTEGRGPGPEWFWKLAEDLGDVVDPIGFDRTSFRPTRAFQRGYADALREVYGSVEHGASPDWAGTIGPTSSQPPPLQADEDGGGDPSTGPPARNP